MKFLKITILLNLIGTLYFNVYGLLEMRWSVNAYYIWDKFCGAGLMLWVSLLLLLPYKDKWLVRPIAIMATIKAIFVILAVCFGWNFNNDWWLATMFILISLCSGFLMLNENSKGNKWLSRYLPL